MISDIEGWVGQALPPPHRAFLNSQADDLSVGDFVLLYGQASFVERNETYEVKQYCPGYVTIGDDGGGRQLLLSLETGQVSLVDAGSMNPAFAEAVAEGFGDWLTSGCPLPDEEAA